MRTREVVGFLVAGLFVVLFTIATVIELLVGDDASDLMFTAVVLGLGALGWFIWVRRSLEKQGVPWRCSAEGAKFHKLKETGNPYKKPRIWECSVCGVHREVTPKSLDDGGE